MTSAAKLTTAALAFAALAASDAAAHAARLPNAEVRARASDSAERSPARSSRRRVGAVGLSVRFGGSRVSLRARDLPSAGDDLVAFARVTGNDVSEVDFHERLMTVTPSLHVGGDGYFFRVDAPVGFSSGVKTFGLGLYPLNFGLPVADARVMPYAGAGVVGSVVLSDSAGGVGAGALTTGGLFQARTAVGIKLLPGRRADLSLELGYSPWAIGGVVSQRELERAAAMFERGQQVREPSHALRAGAGDVWDLSVGVGWL